MINIDIKYKGQLTSDTFNRKFNFLYGANVILSGFAVTPTSGMQVSLASGVAAINGVTIEDTVSQLINIDAGTLPTVAPQTFYIYLTYDHTTVSTVFGSTSIVDVVNDSRSLVFATIAIPAGVSAIQSAYITAGLTVLSMKDVVSRMYQATANDDTKTDATVNKLVSNAQMNKLKGIAVGANNYVHPTMTFNNTTGSGLSFITGVTLDASGHVSGVATRAALLKADITALGIPAQDTTYSANDDSQTDITKNKLVSNAQMNKLLGVAANANNYTLVAPTGSALGGVKAGTNKGVSIDASGILSVTGIDGSLLVATTGHLHPIAGVSGLQTALDLKANETEITALNTQISGMGSGMIWKPAVASFAAIASTYPTPAAGWIVPVTGDTNYVYNGTTWTQLSPVPAVTTTTNGMMLATDKVKLNSLTGGTDLPSGYHTTPWGQITSVPTTFTPAAHGHPDPVTNPVYAVYAA